MESLLFERREDGLYASGERTNGRVFGPYRMTDTEDALHTWLATYGWVRVGPAKGDPIAGVYTRTREAGRSADLRNFGYIAERCAN